MKIVKMLCENFVEGKLVHADFPFDLEYIICFFLHLLRCNSIIGTTDDAYELVCWNYIFHSVECRMQEASISDRAVSSDIRLSVSRFREFIQLVE